MKALLDSEHVAMVITRLLLRLGVGALVFGAYSLFLDHTMFFYR